MEIISKTRKVGGSLMITIPKNIVEIERIQENQTLVLELKKTNISGFGISKGIGPFTKESKFRGQLEK